jgi:lysyl-tRNA synthetase class 1
VGKVISERIFNYPAPVFQGYEFIGIKGSAGKMSSSSGLNLTPETLLKIYLPEVILWLYSRNDPMKAFNFCFDDEILRHYFEFDKTLTAYLEGTADDYNREIMDAFMAGRKGVGAPVSMSQLVQFGSIVNWDCKVLEGLFSRIDLNYTKEQFGERLVLAKNWLEMCSPESVIRLNTVKNKDYFDTLSIDEKRLVSALYKHLRESEFDMEGMRTMLYAVVSEIYGEIDEVSKKKFQTRFFEIVYTLLISKTTGPRLYLFLSALDKNEYLHLLKF